MSQAVLVSAVRTPFGKLGGALKDFSSIELGTIVVRNVVERSGLAPDSFDGVFIGAAILVGAASVAARQILIKAGLPDSTPSLTLDRACCSSMTCIALGMKEIQLGEASALVAGGLESMSQTPYLLRDGRWGKRLGDMTVEDPLAMRNPITGTPIAVVTGKKALEFGITREMQDEWALGSHQKYFAALGAGKFKDEMLPLEAKTKKGPGTLISVDEQPRADTTLEKLAKLEPVYGSPTITAGNAPGLNDGASAVVLMSAERQRAERREAIATVLAYGHAAGDPSSSVFMPALALKNALKKAGVGLDELKRIEINEAFAAMPLTSAKVLADGDAALTERLRSITNVNGGAVAIGHATGASGARLVMTLAYELRRLGGGIGAAAICGGYGQSDAIVLRV